MDRFFAALPLCVSSLVTRGQSRNSAKRNRVRLPHRVLAIGLALLFVASCAFFISSYRAYARIVDQRLSGGYLLSRGGIYAAPRTLRPGQKYSADSLARVLSHAGYVENEDAGDIWNGSFFHRGETIELHPATFSGLPETVQISFDAGRISKLIGDGLNLDSITLAPETLTNDAWSKSGVRNQVSFKDLPPRLVGAITSIEDRRFFAHHGLDIFGVFRALLRNAGDERIGQGGSTITQQLVKNSYLTPERTLRRKYAEAMLAFSLERRLSKEEIFALYCNEIYLGQRGAFAIRGVEQAARIYFGKQLQDLSVAEAATIAGLIQGPTRYSPLIHPAAARARRDIVLGTMARDGVITLEQAAEAAREPLWVANFDPARESTAPYFIDYVNRVLEARETKKAQSRNEPGPAVERPEKTEVDSETQVPLVTTLDLDLQQVATQSVNDQLLRLDQKYQPRGLQPQVALVALDSHDGSVLAMIGGRDYAKSQLNRTTDAKRQPGSVFKPFVYAAAVEEGISPLTIFKDVPREFTYGNNLKYRPTNYGGGFSMRDLPMRDGLIKSLNVMTVDLAMQTGLARVANTALAFGLPRPVPFPALALGTTEVTPLQMAAAYAVFANGGRRVGARVLAETPAGGDQEPVISPATAFVITNMLEDVIDVGTARSARGFTQLSAVAGKTGTSRDGWFVGYTANLVCAVWVGFDDNRQLGLTGAEAALPIWTEFMKAALDRRPELGAKSFAEPEGVSIVDIDPDTNELATAKCPRHQRVALPDYQTPRSECFKHTIYFDLVDTQPQSDDRDHLKAKSLPARQSRQQPPPEEFSLLLQTRVDLDKSGRRILVNEMRLPGK